LREGGASTPPYPRATIKPIEGIEERAIGAAEGAPFRTIARRFFGSSAKAERKRCLLQVVNLEGSTVIGAGAK